MKKLSIVVFVLLATLLKLQGQSLSVDHPIVTILPVANATGTFNITAEATTWTITEDAGWLSVSHLTGTLSALITVTAEANASGTVRSTIVTISGTGGVANQTVTVNQSGGTLSVLPITLTVPSNANSSGTFEIASNTSWIAVSSQPWLTLSSGSGAGNATITVTVEMNSLTTSRSADITVTGNGLSPQTITVTQDGAAASLTLSTTSVSVNAAAGSTGTFGITSNTTWTVISSQTWLTVSSGSGSDNATITVTAEVNSSLSSRTATVTVTGNGLSPQTVTVTQNGAAASLTLSTTSVSVNAAAGSTGTFGITSNTTWTVVSSQTWLTVSSGSGSDNATITVTAEVNSSLSSRTATVTVTGNGLSPQTVTVTQNGAAASLTLSTTSVSVNAAAGSTGTFGITSNTTWTVVSSQTWLTVSSGSGSDNATITVTAEVNSSLSSRTATVTVTGNGLSPQTVTVTQNGAAASLTLSTTSVSVNAAAGSTGTFGITSNTTWTVVSSQTWLTVSSGSGSDNATITVTAEVNSSLSSRTATVTVTGNGLSPQTVTVTQNGAAASLTLSTTSVSVAAAANSTGTFNITSNTTWNVASNQTWLTVSPASSVNNGTVTVTATSANPSTSTRSATVTVSGSGVSDQTVTVTQAGIPTFTVSLSSSPIAGGSTSGGGTFNSGTSATVIATPSTGYTFVNWTEEGTPVSTSASYTFTVNANRTLVANFSLRTHTVATSSSPTAGGTTGGGGTFNFGTSVMVSATPSTGYTFVNWTEGGASVSTSASYTFTVNANRTLVANFSLNTHTVATSSSPTAGGTTGGGGTFNFGTSVTVSATPSTGYAFVNWTEGGASVSTSASYTFTINANRTLVANFSLNTYTIATSLVPAGGGTTNGAGSYSYGTSATVTATTNTGYTFVNWTEGGTPVSSSASYTFTVNANRTLVANFSLNTYTVATSSSPSAGGTTSGGGTFNYGTSVTVSATPNTGYTFVNWTEGGTSVSTSTSYSFTLSTNRAFVANFSLNTYTVATSSNPTAGGTTSGGGTFNYGSSVTISATPSTGYTFVNWTEGGASVSTSASYTFTINANRTLVANFSLITYTVATSSSPTAGGTTNGAGSYSYGTSATVTATTNTGYTFVNWTEGGTPVSTSASYTFTVNVNRTLVANLRLNTYTVATSSSPSAGGTTSGGGTYNYGTSVTVIATSATGYQFVNWTEGGTAISTSASYTYTATTNRTLLANFSLLTYTVSISSSPSAGGTTNGAGSYSYGTPANVIATPSTGYQFNNWTEGSTVVSTNVSYAFTVTGNRTIVANFSLITYSISTSSNPSAGGTTSGGGTYNMGVSTTVTATPASGYQFLNWTEGGIAVSTNPSYHFLVYGSRTLVATFQSISFITINTLSSPGSGGTTTGAGTYTTGSIISVTATPATGYQFANWTEGGSVVSTGTSYSFTVSANRTLVANFNLLTYSISTSSSPATGGSTSGGGTYNYGNGATVSANPANGYQFVNWTQGGTSVSTNSSYTFTVTGNRTLVANFSQITYTIITLSSPTEGGATTGGGGFNYGASATVFATPSSGYLFVNWSEGGSAVSTNPSYSFNVTSGRTLVANFSQIIYTIATSSSPAGGGSTSGGSSYNSGSSATVTATPATGYQFVNWTQGGSSVSTSASYSFTVTSNITLVANFTLASYTVTTSSSPAEGGTTTGGGGYNYGASVTVSAVPGSGYLFVNWSEGGSVVSTNPSYSFTVSRSRSLLANFNQIPKILNITDANGNALHNNDIIRIDNSDAGSFSIKVESNAEWTVSENCLWFKAVKESSTSINITYLENISVIDKTASMKVFTALNAEMQINLQQKARVSQLNVSKFETIKLYPNPANDFAYLYFGEEFSGILRITVASIHGLVVQTRELTDIEANQIIDLDVAGLKSGPYLVKVSGKTGQKVFQMIKY